jgi:GAF domain-containing protein
MIGLITPPVDESERLVALRRAELLDTPPEEVFDRLTQLASELLHVPVAVVSLVDADREFFKSAVGLPTEWSNRREAPRTMSLAETAMLAKAPLAIEDAREHPLVKNNPIIPEWGVVSYAGVPLQTKDGHAIGSVYVADRVPRAWTSSENDHPLQPPDGSPQYRFVAKPFTTDELTAAVRTALSGSLQ